MMLKTSSRKINPFINMIGFTTRKNLGIIIVLCILALIYCPGSFIINYYNTIVEDQSYVAQYILREFAATVTIFSTLVAIGFNVLNLNFMYKKNSSDVFHSFPLTRTELLLSRTLASLVSTAIPLSLCYISMSILLACNSWMGSFLQLLFYLLHTIVIVLVCSSFSLVFIICAGSMFDLGVSLIGANAALLFVGSIFDNILSETLTGYNTSITSDILYNLSPPFACAEGLGFARDVAIDGISKDSIEFLIRSIIYIIAFTTVSILLYKHRKAEKSEQGYAYKFMYIFCSMLAGISGGYLLGMMFDQNLLSGVFWFFLITGALITTTVYSVVTNRGFKGFARSLIIGGISSTIIIIVTVVGFTGAFGYTNRIPEIQSVKSVEIDAFGESMTFENPENVIALHSAILETNATDITNTSYRFVETVEFTYHLNNGSTLTREFHIVTDKVEQPLLNIYKSQERLSTIKGSLPFDFASYVEFNFRIDESFYSVLLTPTEAKSFLDAYWLDVQNCDSDIFGDEYYGNFEFNIHAPDSRYEYFSLENHKSFVNARQFIADLNLVERADQPNPEDTILYDKKF